MASPMIAYPFKRFDCGPCSSGGAAMILGSLHAAQAHQTRPAFINGVGGSSDSNWIADCIVPSAHATCRTWRRR